MALSQTSPGFHVALLDNVAVAMEWDQDKSLASNRKTVRLGSRQSRTAVIGEASCSTKQLAPVSVALVHGDPNFFYALRQHLKVDDQYRLIWHELGALAIQKIPLTVALVVILEANLPDMSGVDCLARLKILAPQIHYLMILSPSEKHTLYQSLIAGANGILATPCSPQECQEALRQVVTHRGYLSPQFVRHFVEGFHELRNYQTEHAALTNREQEVLCCIFQKLCDKEIAVKLSISVSTVHAHTASLFKKIGVNSRREVIAKYFGASPFWPQRSTASFRIP